MATARRESWRPWRYFLLALGLGWLFWGPLALPTIMPDSPLWWPLTALGGLSPTLAAVYLLWRHGMPAQRRDFWRRLIDLRRIPGRWHAAIWLFWPAVSLLAIWLAQMLADVPADWSAARDLLANPLSLLGFAAFTFLFGPLPEELGWRGYALPGLQARLSPLAASLVIGAVWGLWHLPLFLAPGTYQHDQIGLGAAFWVFVGSTTAGSVLYAWLVNKTGGSILAAILFHFMTNASGEFLAVSLEARPYQLLLVTIAAAIVVVVWGPSLGLAAEEDTS
jgi:membrane protease YdiL (CAAX protease family)